MYLPAKYVSDMKEERDKEAEAAAQEDKQSGARLLLAAAREEITSLKAKITSLQAALAEAQQDK